ncbi:MAG TPA: hypothetical protein VKP68_04235 [Ramlibacter sp.]|nr:hypothetical protein [Ramlibacter sp.]
MNRVWLLAAVVALVSACADQPRVPDWQVNAAGALERYVFAALTGDARVEPVEFERARRELASTGQPGMVARAELTRCAVRLASLDLSPCEGFEALRSDSPAPERAYADYLAGRITPADVALLPPQHRAVATEQGDVAAVKSIADPLSRLVAAGVLFRLGRASPEVLVVASDTASTQGWRRPLLAWLGVQALRAEQAGAVDEAQRLRRRMALVTGTP